LSIQPVHFRAGHPAHTASRPAPSGPEEDRASARGEPAFGADAGVAPPASLTDHLKLVPAERAQRERIRCRAIEVASRLDHSRPLVRHRVESHARTMLADLGLTDRYLGWSMVALASAFWRVQVESIPCERRLLLLPHCLRDAAACPAEYDERGLMCQDCGACPLSGLRARARARGYQVLIAEGSPAVIDIILRGEADAILGAACLNSLEKAFDKILLAGIPCMAVPLLHNACRDTRTDEDWVREMIDTPHRGGGVRARTYVHLLRLARKMFEPDELARLLRQERSRPAPGAGNGHPGAEPDPVAATETIACDFLARGGKHLRPFITLAAYDAMTGGSGAGPDGAAWAARTPDAVRRVALAIEVFHKASLVHDDIEDDDPFRYGLPTLHRKHGTAAAINVGDWLIGLGYRLVAEQRAVLLNDRVVDVLGRLAEAHTRLCEGQGAELAWRDGSRRALTPLDALKIYALKTSPAFEAALYAGLRLAGPAGDWREPVARFARHLGVGFQVLNDLHDWDVDQPNKRTAGSDALGRRPTVLWALAVQCLEPQARRELQGLTSAAPDDPAATLQAVRRLYEQAGVYDQARTLVVKHRQRAHEVAEALQPAPLGQLLHYLADTILEG